MKRKIEMYNINEKAKRRLAWGSFVCVLILYHLSLKVYCGDDYAYFSKVLNNNDIITWLAMRYNSWSSRIIIEAMLVFFARHIFIWKILNILVNILLAYSLHKLSHGISLFTVLVLLLSYPLADMGSAGWIATYMNYYWPLALGLYSLIVLDKLTRGEKIKWWEIMLSFIAVFIGVNVEQYCAVHFALLLLITAYLIISKAFHKIWVVIVHCLIVCSSLVFILLAPGNEVRKSGEVVSWMKDFYEKTVMDKVIDGFERTMSALLSSNNIIFLVFALFLFICIWKKTENVTYRIIGGFPSAVALFISFGRIDANGFFGDLTGLISSNTGVTAQNWIKLSCYLPLWIYGFTVASIIMSFFIICDDFFKAFECSYIFCVAIASGIIMGFSPTLFASAARILIFCYFLLILLVMRLLEYTDNMFSEREATRGKTVMSVLCVIIVLNNIVCAGNMV